MNKKTIWITGGSTGIGKALANLIAKALPIPVWKIKSKD